MQSRPKYLVVAKTGRALAASAKRGGCPVYVLDCFADRDTCGEALSVKQIPSNGNCFDADLLRSAVEEICLEHPGMQLIPGNGFEQQAGLLQVLSEIAPCAGNPAEVVRNIKDPLCFFGLLDELGIPYPPTTAQHPQTGHNWLRKSIGGMGGDHIAHMDKNNVLPGSGVYYQQFIEGKSFSVLFLANGRQACVLGFSELWHTDEFPDTPFKYGGAISLSTPPEMFADGIHDLPDTICRLVAASGLKGLCGLDFILDKQNRFHVLEINPRPPATFELHERDGGLFSAHLQACHGHLPGNKPVFDAQIHAHMILYARRTLHVPLQMKWPSWSADRPQSGRKITFAEPVCTIKANGHEQVKVKKLLYERRFALEAELLRWQDAA